MSAVKGLAVGIVAVVGIGQPVRGEPVRWGSWRWTSWVAGRGVIQEGQSGAFAFDPPASVALPAPAPAAFAPPAPVPPPAPAPLPAPENWQNLGRFATTSPVASAPPAASPGPAAAVVADAFLNFGPGPFAKADLLTRGGAQPWYNSPVVSRVFGGVPDERQRAEFTGAVLRDVEQAYRRNGLPLTLTDNPAVPAAHTLSVVSGTSNASHPDAIGITSQGTDGFSFVDKFGDAQSVDQLRDALGNNLKHELMHAVGVDHHDTSGRFLDAAAVPFSVLSDPATDFSRDAVQDLASKDFRQTSGLLGGLSSEQIDGQAVTPRPVPEPAALGLWGLAAAGAVLGRRGSRPARRAGLETARRA